MWGVEPHPESVDVLPQQTIDALKMSEADLLPENIEGRQGSRPRTTWSPRTDHLGRRPTQLQWALVLLQTRAIASGTPEHNDQALADAK